MVTFLLVGWKEKRYVFWLFLRLWEIIVLQIGPILGLVDDIIPDAISFGFVANAGFLLIALPEFLSCPQHVPRHLCRVHAVPIKAC